MEAAEEKPGAIGRRKGGDGKEEGGDASGDVKLSYVVAPATEENKSAQSETLKTLRAKGKRKSIKS